ncbi:FkbM family methyltransferase [Ferrovibrio sp.]|uniref:FkbM family methyltransferase n=1 Tax=Ferrovibrio sp. TaxID=1917215 RepID=UPI001B7988E2|nr:FkbM family methyltransferase [Ferrovibrio sp.]MBP7063044.1 FkbM family methyltransferase [Ferrovibrio sp.]
MAWEPPSTFEEKLKYSLIPGSLYIRYRVWKELRRGERELALVPFLVDPVRAALDVGANKGVWTWMLAQHCRQVFALEPNPKPFRVLQRCKPQNAEAWQVAASNATGTAELRIPLGRKGYSNQGGSLNAAKVGASYGSVSVPAKRLDDCGLPPVGFIKIDVEGFEAEVLAGAADLIRRDRPVLVIEMEEAHTRKPIETMVAEVEALGYAAYALRKGQLTHFARLDPETNHRAPPSRADYVFNFIFLPL